MPLASWHRSTNSVPAGVDMREERASSTIMKRAKACGQENGAVGTTVPLVNPLPPVSDEKLPTSKPLTRETNHHVHRISQTANDNKKKRADLALRRISYILGKHFINIPNSTWALCAHSRSFWQQWVHLLLPNLQRYQGTSHCSFPFPLPLLLLSVYYSHENVTGIVGTFCYSLWQEFTVHVFATDSFATPNTG